MEAEEAAQGNLVEEADLEEAGEEDDSATSEQAEEVEEESFD